MDQSRMPSGQHRSSPATQPPHTLPAVRRAALALGVTAAAAAVCLLIMFLGVGPLGTVNDVLNGVVGWLALALAVVVLRAEPHPVGRGATARAAVGAAVLGAVGMTWGSWLVLSGTTGYYLAGLVSSLGVAAVGLWLVLAHAASGSSDGLGGRTARLGRNTGFLMTLGVLALPAALSGVDDIADAAWYAWVSGLAWLGVYVLLPVWCVRLAQPDAQERGTPSRLGVLRRR